MGEIVPVLLLTIVIPTWLVLHYVTKMKTSKGLSVEDEKMLSEVWESTNRMEDRIKTLERILDIEAPNWRGRS